MSDIVDEDPSTEDFVEGLREFRDNARALAKKAKKLVDSVSFDNSGSLVAGHWVSGNGGLCSRETLRAADELRLELAKWS
jgi:hypothetical protein